jgi:hypothetical protein
LPIIEAAILHPDLKIQPLEADITHFAFAHKAGKGLLKR